MASIGTTLPSSTTASTTSTTASGTGGSSSLATQKTFLQLLVAQLQNQDPTQPVQGTEFVTQLATFTDVEENLAVQQDEDAISNKYLGYVPSGATVVTAPSGTGTTSTGASTTSPSSGT